MDNFQTNMRSELISGKDYTVLRLSKGVLSIEKITYTKGIKIKRGDKTAYLTNHYDSLIQAFLIQCWNIEWDY
jgi:hypothetical protein